ncbi:MAG: MaoC family dehydratase N-terminal domain-containing protein [Alphaproteobacteria bacterium]|nr:MaoC family dehydratase N-terminal domain-containing protein [Alphaproteobacteria bacterium]
MDDAEIDAQIDMFIARSRELNGREIWEREVWNHSASADAIRHFAYGTDDDNPLWLDEAYARRTRHGGLVAPPCFLVSVLYPMLHGAAMKAPLSSLVGGVEYEWTRPIMAGTQIRPIPVQTNCYEKRGSGGRRLVFIISEVRYVDHKDELIGRAKGTIIQAKQLGTQLQFDRPVHRYNATEIAAIEEAWRGEVHTGDRPLYWDDVAIGTTIPPIVRGPLTMGDLVAWNSAIGPSYRAGRSGWIQIQEAQHLLVTNPVTNWSVKSSQQHEDGNLSALRGMPGPFDHGVMRFAYVAPLITNWCGNHGHLKRLYVQVKRPAIYYDTQTFSAIVSGKTRGGIVSLDITGTNQAGELTTVGSADVILPPR